MSIERLDLASPNLVNANFEKLAELFPNCVTESTSGKVIDFDLLKQELSGAVIEGNKERYRLEWPGKREAIVTANLPTTKTLRPVREDSVDFDTTENLYIEGDNLEVLKLLQESYLGKIKMIYIDPPYNTGKDFVYKDNFTGDKETELFESGQRNEYNQRLVVNPETAGRYHSDWLTMIYPRLKLARNLLKEDGVIFISIDDNEVHNLRKVCDEIFIEYNHLAKLIWKSGRTSSGQYTNENEYVLVYAKDKDSLPYFTFNGDQIVSDRAIKRPSLKNSVSVIDFPAGIDFESPDRVFPNEFGEKEPVKIVKGKFEAKNGKLKNPVSIEAAWTMKDQIKNWLDGKKVVDQKGQVLKRFFFKKNGVLQYEKEKGTIHPKTSIDGISTKQGTISVLQLFESNPFDFPKPPELIKELAEPVLGAQNSDIILDFFAGSSSTAHGIFELNAKDGGNRKFILVQLPEEVQKDSVAAKMGYNNICQIGRERIILANKGIKKTLEIEVESLYKKIISSKLEFESKSNSDLIVDSELEDSKNVIYHLENLVEFKSEVIKSIDLGFRYFRLDDSNMQDVYYKPQDYKQGALDLFADNVRPDRTPDDLLLQVMLDWGLPLSLKIEQITVAHKQVFKVAENSLYACFDKGIDESFAKEIAQEKPLRIVFRDNGFINDTAKTNVKQLLIQLSPETEMKVI